MEEKLDHPFDDVVKQADKIIAQGGLVFFKWTCAKCGSRQTFERANTIWVLGQCEECRHITNLKDNGCNYAVMWSSDGSIAKILPPEQTPFG